VKLVISDTKAGKAYSKKTEEDVFLNKRIGDEVDLGIVGLVGFKAKITGGSDKQGFPMKPTVEGQGRRKILVRKGVGVKLDEKGKIVRKSMRGNSVSKEIVQLNLAVTKEGSTKLDELIRPGEGKEEKKESVKEKLVKQSLENVGNVALAEEAKNIKGKVRG
jgi:small subunit ribosomal protein S6e